MRWARNIAGVVAGIFSACAIVSAFIRIGGAPTERLRLTNSRSGLDVLILTGRAIEDIELRTGNFVGPPQSVWWSIPRYDFFSTAPQSAIYWMLVPHWLTNLVAWSAFILLWRNCRKPPEGHCQKCGYDLTGNTTGRCPECRTVTPAAENAEPKPQQNGRSVEPAE